MSKCYRCDSDITVDNETAEHIILNACGGRLKSKDLLCRTCNSIFGDTFDKALAKQTNDIANLLLIKREKGEPQSIKGKIEGTEDEYYLQYGGSPLMSKPIINEVVDGEKVELSITARNEKEFKRILQGLKRKYPQIDIEEAVKSSKHQRRYLDEAIHFETHIGGDEVFKSITKTAINFYLLKGGEVKYIKPLIPYLNGQSNLDIVWLHYPDSIIYLPTDGEVSHVIRLVGQQDERILYVYIELFNTHNFIVKLNEDYSGQNIDETYVFDILEIKELNRVIPLNYSRGQIIDFLENKDARPFQKVQSRFERVLGISMKRQSSNHNHQLINRAINNSLGKFPDGVPITKEMTNKLIEELMNEIEPLIIHQFKRREKRDGEM